MPLKVFLCVFFPSGYCYSPLNIKMRGDKLSGLGVIVWVDR